jgi:hypothetical protein
MHEWTIANIALTPLMWKNRLCSDANCELVNFSNPVSLSNTAFVAVWYLLNASEDKSSKVVAVSNIPDVCGTIGSPVVPYVMD